MRYPKSSFHAHARPRTWLLALSVLGCAAANADEPSPWYVGASEGLTHDSNVSRLSNDIVDPNGRGDTYSSTSLLGGFDQNYGRQHFFGKANVAYNKYDHHSALDNTSYGVNTGWDWASIWQLSGGFFASANQSLAQLNGNTVVQTLDKNVVRSEQVGANLNWGGVGDLGTQASFVHSRVNYSLDTAQLSNSSSNSGSLGVTYRLGPTLTTGLAYRLSRTDAFEPGSAASPSGTTTAAVPYTSTGRNIDLTLNWNSTAQTGFSARLSFTNQGNAGGTGQDFSGLTGSLTASYAPTAKIGLSASFNRDAGANGSFFNESVLSGTASNPVLSFRQTFYQNTTVANTLALGANYAATAKIGVNSSYTYRSATISSTQSGVSDYNDKLQVASLGASWAVGRIWSLGCNLSHEKRDVQQTPVYAYTANVIGCSAQVTLR